MCIFGKVELCTFPQAPQIVLYWVSSNSSTRTFTFLNCHNVFSSKNRIFWVTITLFQNLKIKLSQKNVHASVLFRIQKMRI